MKALAQEMCKETEFDAIYATEYMFLKIRIDILFL